MGTPLWVGIEEGSPHQEGHFCPILKGDVLGTKGGLAALLWPLSGAQLWEGERDLQTLGLG